MLRRTFIALTAVAALSPALAQEQAAPRELTDAERALITEINTHNSAIKTMVGRFLQIDTQGSRIEGTFFLERPGKVRFNYDGRSGFRVISYVDSVVLENPRMKTMDLYPLSKTPLKLLLDDIIDL